MDYKLFDAPDVTLPDAEADASGVIVGYASTFANFDDVGERVVKGAFAESLSGFLRDGFIAFGHRWDSLPIATPAEAVEDEHGLRVRGVFHSHREAQDARAVMRERLERGKSVKLSIGYEVLQDERTDAGRLLTKLKLYEWSYVVVPANALAAVTGVKRLPPGGGPLLAFAEAVDASVSTLRDFVRETSDLEGRRSKAGRVLSDANLKLVDRTIGTAEELLSMLQELRKRGAVDDDEEKARARREAETLLAEFQRTSLYLSGVLHP